MEVFSPLILLFPGNSSLCQSKQNKTNSNNNNKLTKRPDGRHFRVKTKEKRFPLPKNVSKWSRMLLVNPQQSCTGTTSIKWQWCSMQILLLIETINVFSHWQSTYLLVALWKGTSNLEDLRQIRLISLCPSDTVCVCLYHWGFSR